MWKSSRIITGTRALHVFFPGLGLIKPQVNLPHVGYFWQNGPRRMLDFPVNRMCVAINFKFK